MRPKLMNWLKQKDENSQNSKKSHTHASHSKDHESLGEESLRINDYYQPPLGEIEEKSKKAQERLG